MMELTTPAMLFPAISLLLLAYTNRFVVLANIIRQLSRSSEEPYVDLSRRQIANLRKRMTVIRQMQAAGVSAFILCTLCMFALFVHLQLLGHVLFGASLVLLVVSLLLSLFEVQISTQAINIELERMDRGDPEVRPDLKEH